MSTMTSVPGLIVSVLPEGTSVSCSEIRMFSSGPQTRSAPDRIDGMTRQVGSESDGHDLRRRERADGHRDPVVAGGDRGAAVQRERHAADAVVETDRVVGHGKVVVEERHA